MHKIDRRPEDSNFFSLGNYCTILILGTQLNAVGAMYAKEYFPESSKNIVNDMVTNIK